MKVHKQKPDFIGVGGEKTASTWIYQCLCEHPAICGVNVKEISYFDTVKLINQPKRTRSRYEVEGLDPYLAYFSHCSPEQVTGEFTATYLHDIKVASILAKEFPDVKILISLRNPIDRTFSMWQGLRAEDQRPFGSFEHALQLEPEFLRRSYYHEYVQLYFDHFPREQIHIVLYDDVLRDPVTTIQNVFAFLGADNTFVPQNAAHKTRSAETKRIQDESDRLQHSLIGRFAKTTLKSFGLAEFSKKIYLRTRKREVLSPQQRKKLHGIFEHDIEKLSTLLERDLSHWN